MWNNIFQCWERKKKNPVSHLAELSCTHLNYPSRGKDKLSHFSDKQKQSLWPTLTQRSSSDSQSVDTNTSSGIAWEYVSNAAVWAAPQTLESETPRCTSSSPGDQMWLRLEKPRLEAVHEVGRTFWGKGWDAKWNLGQILW